MANMPEYDKDRYKPSHEKVNPKTKVGTIANDFHLRQLKKFKENANRRRARSEGKLAKNTPIFVPTNLKGPLEGQEDSNSNKLFIVTSVYAGLFLVFALMSFSWFTDSLRLPIWATILVQITLGITIYVTIVARRIYKVDDKRITASRTRGNKSINMAGVWGINPGGISEEVFYGGTNTTVTYQGKEAIVLKLLKKSVLISDARQDWNHYNSIEKMEALLLKNGFQFSKFNVKYDTNNDYIWDNLDDNLADSAITYGKQYSDLMVEFTTNLKKNTEIASRVTVVYYIIKPNMVKTDMSLKEVAIQVPSLLKNARCTISPVTNQEYLRLIREYYGLRYLDVEEIVDNLSAFDTVPVDINLLGYIDENGQVIDLKEEFKLNIRQFYKQLEVPDKDIKDPERTREVNLEKYSIYGDKIIEQA